MLEQFFLTNIPILNIKKNITMIKYLSFLLLILWSTITVAVDCNADYIDTLPAERFEAPQIVVNEEKLYFHSYPDESCIDNNVYIVKNDMVNSYGTSGEFTFVNFTEKAGWVKTAALEKIDIKSISLDQDISFLDFIVKNDHLTMWPEQTIDNLVSQNSWLKNDLAECIVVDNTTEIFVNDNGFLHILADYLYPDTYYEQKRQFIPAKPKNQLGCKTVFMSTEANSIRSISFSRNTQTLRGIKIGSTLQQLNEAYKDNFKIVSTDEGDRYSIHYRNLIMEFLVYQNLVTSINVRHTL